MEGEALYQHTRGCGLSWSILKPGYGVGWALRPLKVWLLGRLEPAQFYLLRAREPNS